jgi:hypothetical protein
MLNENYCDSGEAYKAVFYYKPIGCAPLPPSVTEPPNEIMTSPSDLFTINTDSQVSSGYDVDSSVSIRHLSHFYLLFLPAFFLFNRGVWTQEFVKIVR